MKIISNFKDYYDGVAKLGQDRSLVYLRKRVELEAEAGEVLPKPSPSTFHPGKWAGRRCSVELNSFWLVVAGRVYRGGMATLFPEGWHPSQLIDTREWTFLYSLSALADYLQAAGCAPLDHARGRLRYGHRRIRTQHEREDRMVNAARASWFSHPAGSDELRNVLAERGLISYGENIQGKTDEYGRLMLPYVLNPRLADFQFGKVLDPHQVFQELSMWIGGVLPRQGAMTASVSDADRFVEHGFDAKTSFRGASR